MDFFDFVEPFWVKIVSGASFLTLVWNWLKERVWKYLESINDGVETWDKSKRTIEFFKLLIKNPKKTIRGIISSSSETSTPDVTSVVTLPEPIVVERKRLIDNLFTLPTIFGFGDEIATLDEHFKKYRVIEIMGPGGVGKSTLSNTYATYNKEKFLDGCCFVQLAPIKEPNNVARVTLETFKVDDVAKVIGKSYNYKLTEFLKDRNVLLLLDNCEHLTSEVSNLIHEIYRECPGVFILTTSQRNLDLGNISIPFHMEGMNTGKEGMVYEELIQLDSVKLFEFHVKKVNPSFKLSDRTIWPVVNICRAFNGLPLAILLAAGRTNIYTVEHVEGKSDDFLFELRTTEGSVGLLRHTSMFDAIKWSYDQLTQEEQLAIANLSVFADDFSLAAARSVCFVEDGLSEDRSTTIIEKLLRANLLKSSSPFKGEKRFFLLETIRQFGKQMLIQEGRTVDVQERFCLYYQEFILNYGSMLLTDKDNVNLNILREQIANIRIAFIYMVANEWNEMIIKCVSKFWRFWESGGDWQAGKVRLEHVVTKYNDLETEEMEEMLNGLGTILYRLGDLVNALKYYQRRLGINKKLKSKVKIASSLSDIGNVYSKRMETEKAIDFLLKAKKNLDSINIAGVVGNGVDQEAIIREQAVVQNNLAKQYTLIGKVSEAKKNFGNSIKLFRSIGNTKDITFPLYGLGTVAILEKDYDLAESLLKESLKGRINMKNSQFIAQCQSALALVDIYNKKYEEAKIKLTDSLKRLDETKDPSLILETLMVVVVWLINKGDIESASQLFSYIETKGKLALVYAYFLGITKSMLIENQLQFSEVELSKWDENGRMFDEVNVVEVYSRLLEARV